MTAPIAGMTPTYPYGVKGNLWQAGFHTGEDYAARAGTVVLATKAGRVVGLGNVWGSAYGSHQVVIESLSLAGVPVRHGYMHMRSYSVKMGQVVQAGQSIGQVGEEGNATGPHLHYEERKHPFMYNAVCRRPRFPSLGTWASSLLTRWRPPPPTLSGRR